MWCTGTFSPFKHSVSTHLICSCSTWLDWWIFLDLCWSAAVFLQSGTVNISRFALICSCFSWLNWWIFPDSHRFAAVFPDWTGEYSQIRTDLQLFYLIGLVNISRFVLICSCFSTIRDWWIFPDLRWFAAVFPDWTGEYSQICTDLQLFYLIGRFSCLSIIKN